MSKLGDAPTWAFALQETLSRVVQEKFEAQKHRWPILKAFNFEGYQYRDSHLVIILRDKISGIPSGSEAKDFDEQDCHLSPPSVANIEEWLQFIFRKFHLRNSDAAVIVPITDIGGTVEDQFGKWSEDDKLMWHRQIQHVVTIHFYHLKGFDLNNGFFLSPGYQFLADDCSRFFQDHPEYEKNVFIMTRFVPGNRLLEELDHELRACLRSLSYNPLRADDKMYLRDRNLWNNVCVYMQCCSHGIAILEDRIADEFNPNIAIEYGFMRALNKPVLLLADSGFRNLRADVIGTLRGQFDITDISGSIRKPIEKWISELSMIDQQVGAPHVLTGIGDL